MKPRIFKAGALWACATGLVRGDGLAAATAAHFGIGATPAAAYEDWRAGVRWPHRLLVAPARPRSSWRDRWPVRMPFPPVEVARAWDEMERQR